MPKIILPDGSSKIYEGPVTALNIAEDIGSRLAKAAVAAKVDGRLVDLNRPIENDAAVEIVTADDAEGKDVLRHSSAHLMAQALKRLYPGTKLAIGPTIDNGFYYDVDCPETLSSHDFDHIEQEMVRIVKEQLPIQREEVSKQEAESLFQEMGEDYKVELLKDLEDGNISLYRQGEFVDLCRGPHVPNTGKIKAFKLMKVAGAYWRGDSDREMLQRLYGTAFPKKNQLEEYLHQLEEAERRDHRKLGKQLDLFSFHEESPGFAFWHPKGQRLYRTLEEFSRELQEKRGYQEVATPWIMRTTLWETSGHWDHYKENMFIMESEGEVLAAKPMNCPAHCVLFKEEPRSYRDLPLRMAEYGPLSRYEQSGTLHGMMRVRGLHQDDSHLFVREDQIESEIGNVLELVDEVYSTFGMKYAIKLSTRPDDFMGEIETWDRAEAALSRALEAAGRDYSINPKDGAFYGPKLDFDVTDAIGRQWQCATVQLDFQMPEKFDLTFVGSDGQHRRPVMIHRAIMGSLERFIGILVEHYAGAFPTWLAPEQVRVIPIGENHLRYANKVREHLLSEGLRVTVDSRNEKMGYKIREAQVQKIPYMLVVGDKEMEAGEVAVRDRSEGDLGTTTLADFAGKVLAEVETRGR